MPTFQNGDGSFFNESNGGPVRVEAPTTGATLALAWNERALYVNNGSTLATLTIRLPKKVSPGEKVEVTAKGAVTALTVTDGFSGAITGAPTALAAGVNIGMRYVNSTVGWVRWE